jgi:hypothetical protein
MAAGKIFSIFLQKMKISWMPPAKDTRCSKKAAEKDKKTLTNKKKGSIIMI